MKKMMNAVAMTGKELMVQTQGVITMGYLKAQAAKGKVNKALTGNRGEGFVDTALKILISVVVGALLLAGLYLLFEDTILPTLTNRIKQLFDYKG